MCNSFLTLLLLPFLLLAGVTSDVLVPRVSINESININCGATTAYTDEAGISWVADAPYIQNGEIQTVENTTGIEEPLKTLRVFKSKGKNCYRFGVNASAQLRVRAQFNYGNYDRKMQPPIFDLIFDVDILTTVVTKWNESVWYEPTYVSNNNETSVCVAQSNQDHLPFVSSIEVWELEPVMYRYRGPNYALFTRSRRAFGAPKAIRYPDDKYNRKWVPATINNPTILERDATSLSINLDDRPPAAVFHHAVTLAPTLPSNSNSIFSHINYNSEFVQHFYINLYFAEPTEPNGTRSFAVFVNGNPMNITVTPDHKSALEYPITNRSIRGSLEVELRALKGSSLRPIINAMEVFTVSDAFSSTGTNFSDVAGLAVIMSQFKTIRVWGGDPCLPMPYNWDWVRCSYGYDTPRITALYLNASGLSGEIPDFSSMDALVAIYLNNNSIRGVIPEFLGNLPNLKELNLDDNNLSGSIPSSLCNNNITVETGRNPGLSSSCRSSASSSSDATRLSLEKESSNNLRLILGLVLPLFFFANMY